MSRFTTNCWTLLSLLLLLIPAASWAGPETMPTQGPGQKAVSPQAKAAVEQFMKGESVFIENDGQWKDDSIRFALNSMGANVGLTDHGPRFQLFRRSAGVSPAFSRSAGVPPASSQPTSRRDASVTKNVAPQPAEMHEFGAVFDGANKVAPQGRGKTDQSFNYLVGEVAHQRQNIPSFSSVWYPGLYKGVDLELKGQRTGLKYNFHVAPGGDWRAIRIRYEGIDHLSLTPDGALRIDLAKGWTPLLDATPYLYQEINGQKVAVAGKYRLFDGQTYGFEVTGNYDPKSPLIIDPNVYGGAI